MRILKIMLIVLVMSVVGALLLSCRSGSDSATVTEAQVVTVQRGDLTIDITAVGNLAFSHQEELTFETAGTVEEVLVEVGDSVEEGQVLAKLDDTSIISLQKAVIQARIDLRNAELTGELDLAEVEAAVADAKVALETAREVLEDTEYTESDIARAELVVINAEIALDKAQENLERAQERYRKNRSVSEWAQDFELKQKELVVAEFDLTEAEETLAELMAGADPFEVEQKQKQLAITEINLAKAEETLAEMQTSSDTLEQLEVASAQAALDETMERLEMATMVAPFTGIVTSVDVEAGEAVNANQVVIELVDTDKFEIEILVNETDIFNIQMGAEAGIQVDAIPGIVVPAEVTHIAPIATIQSGVVNYKVKVEIESLEAVMQEWQEAIQETMGDISSGELSERIKQAIEAGRITQEQAEEMMKQRQQGQVGQSGMPTTTPGNFQLREGLTVTVSIILAKRNDVLLVPNGAIIRQGRETYVQMLGDGLIEQRSIITGISDWQYTEVIEGLSEGEEVVMPQGTTTTPTTPQPRGGFPPFGGGWRGGGGEH